MLIDYLIIICKAPGLRFFPIRLSQIMYKTYLALQGTELCSYGYKDKLPRHRSLRDNNLEEVSENAILVEGKIAHCGVLTKTCSAHIVFLQTPMRHGLRRVTGQK